MANPRKVRAHHLMPTYEHTLTINEYSPEQRLLQAAELLARCEGVVILEKIAALRPTPKEIICEAFDPEPGAHRCAEEFKVILENAQRVFAKSRFAHLLPRRPRRWLVVAADDPGTTLWPAP